MQRNQFRLAIGFFEDHMLWSVFLTVLRWDYHTSPPVLSARIMGQYLWIFQRESVVTLSIRAGTSAHINV